MNIRNLDQKELDGLAYYRSWVNDILARGFKLNYRLTGSEDDIPYLDLVLSRGPHTENAADELTILGSTVGDVVSHVLDMRWVVFTDEQGSSFALLHSTKEVFFFPQDLLVKRAEKGSLGTIADLYAPLIAALRQEIMKAKERG